MNSEVDNRSITQVSLNGNQKLIAITNEQKARFMMIGNGIKNQQLNDSEPAIDAVKEMMNFSPSEQYAFKLVIDNIVKNKDYIPTSFSNVVKKNMSSAEKQKFNEGIKRLISKNLLKRKKREHYMMNPRFIVPSRSYSEQLLVYSLL